MRVPDEHQHATPPAWPVIRRLSIERFRGISALTWRPSPGVNIILGGGDVGKTTILEAIALLLSPTNVGTISDNRILALSIPVFLADHKGWRQLTTVHDLSLLGFGERRRR
jgi:recombinational DNA repair ATPase RecF